jgi:hypothetical protein
MPRKKSNKESIFVCPFCFEFRYIYLTKDDKYNIIVNEHVNSCSSRRKKIKKAILRTIEEYSDLLERLKDE